MASVQLLGGLGVEPFEHIVSTGIETQDDLRQRDRAGQKPLLGIEIDGPLEARDGFVDPVQSGQQVPLAVGPARFLGLSGFQIAVQFIGFVEALLPTRLV